MDAPTSFFWHDYETFGRVPRRDRPAQFAGLRTDAGLEEVGEPVMWHCQPAPDYLPDPESCLLTGILPQHALARGLPENEFAARIEAELAVAGTVGVGYNSIRFDDEVTRFLFWRNLMDPYAREWRNGCGRWDLIDVVRCCWALRPEGIEWPRADDGRPSFRLELLTRANGLAHDAAHDALSDVRATLSLARLLRERRPQLWDFCLKLRHKDAVRAEMGVGRPFVHLSGRYGAERGFLSVVWPLAPHPTNRNEVIVWDLAQDPSMLERLDATEIRQRMFSRADELPDGVGRLPVKTIHVNKSPIVIGNVRVLGAAAERWGIDLDRAQAHAARAREVAPAVAGLWAGVFGGKPAQEAVDVDEDLYGGFLGDEDRRRLERLRVLPGEQLAGKRTGFDDPRLEELVFRYRARNFPGTLDEAERARWRQHCAERLLSGAGGALTVEELQHRVDALAEAADERGQGLLEALHDYAEGLASDLL
jgi:exodeoxyribonuclease-1